MESLSRAEDLADRIISRVGKKIRLAIPLGAGKPNHIVNALYRKAQGDPSIELKIYTALTLNKPRGKSFLEKRFLEPFADRVFGNYPNLIYEEDRQRECLPKNISVFEFYFPAGKTLTSRNAQENYISSNYTHVARDLADRGINVLAHLVSPDREGTHVSLSCNADVTGDLITLLEKQGRDFIFVAQTNKNLPYMYGDALVDRNRFTFILDDPKYDFPVFAPPKLSVPDKDHLIGLYASTLIKDGGELQVGIGSLGDALVNSLMLRQQKNSEYLEILQKFNIPTRYKDLIAKKGDTGPFSEGLFGATEMFVDTFMHLIKAGILKRKVYDHLILQRLLNEELITEQVTEKTLYHLLERRAIQPQMNRENVNFLKKFGIFKQDVQFDEGYLRINGGAKIKADLNVDQNFKEIIEVCLGSRLCNGAIIHGGFFLGCNQFYQWLRDLPEEQRKLIHMKTVTKINQLYGHEDLDRLHRKNARFVNTCLKMTLSGGAVSDGLSDGRVISGVGGQYNFVAMAHALPDGHSILQLRSTRMEASGVRSNIVFNYGHITIPRHLRDIVITEYGIADLRGLSDSEMAMALIEISDSRFQQALIKQVKDAGKLKRSYELPEHAKQNHPDRLKKLLAPLKTKGYFNKFPFGTELTKDEILLGGALKSLKKKQRHKFAIVKTLLKGLFINGIPKEFEPAIKRMGLEKPQNLKEKIYQKLILAELS